jgi:hypothetical protein
MTTTSAERKKKLIMCTYGLRVIKEINKKYKFCLHKTDIQNITEKLNNLVTDKGCVINIICLCPWKRLKANFPKEFLSTPQFIGIDVFLQTQIQYYKPNDIAQHEKLISPCIS